MEPLIFDVTGQQRDWAWLTGKYGRLEHRRGVGYPRFELARIEETIGPAILKVRVENDNGAPLGVMAVMTYPDLSNPSDGLPDLMTGNPAKTQWSQRGVPQFTDGMTGLTGFGLGGDSWVKDLKAGGPYHAWLFHTQYASDCLSWIGWKLFTDHAGPCSLVFRLVTAGTPPPPVDPPVEPPVDPEPIPDDDFRVSVLAYLETIATRLDDLVLHLGA